MEEVEYRTVLTDRADLRDALEQIERGLREVRSVMVEDRGHYGGLLDFAADVDRMAVHARQVLARTGASGA